MKIRKIVQLLILYTKKNKKKFYLSLNNAEIMIYLLDYI